MTKEEQFKKFEEDMLDHGRDIEEYHGRNFYVGPAVRVDDDSELQNVIRETTVRVQWDHMGKYGLIIYPA